MQLFGYDISRAKESRSSIESPAVPISDTAALLALFGVSSANLPVITVDKALTVPAFLCGISFLTGCLANLPLNAFRDGDKGAERIKGGLNSVLNEAMNEEWSSFAARKYFWGQVFTEGRGLLWVEWSGNAVVGLWPMDAAETTVVRRAGRRFYRYGTREYPADEIIDVPFLLKRDMLSVHSPVLLATKALQLALAMNDYASAFFAGGGVPPLALEGPMPVGSDALKRAQGDIKRAIDGAKNRGEAIFPIPPSYKLTPVGIDPDKGQMVEARLFQIQEIGRILNLPPVFLQDLSKGTFSNTEQQDLHLAKHTVSIWAKALEDELNLKLFSRRGNKRFVEHNLDGLMRGDFKSRIEGMVRAVQGGLLEPNRGRSFMNWPDHENPMANDLFMQGATVPLGQKPEPAPAPSEPEGGTPPDEEEPDDDE